MRPAPLQVDPEVAVLHRDLGHTGAGAVADNLVAVWVAVRVPVEGRAGRALNRAGENGVRLSSWRGRDPAARPDASSAPGSSPAAARAGAAPGPTARTR
ncbi:hypothetical protein [Streptomyces toxytricini]|uniref:hypothetical protein n=1 Tax=Streptomyces toxytricini TaxID=67369 RepID=UPI0034379D96